LSPFLDELRVPDACAGLSRAYDKLGNVFLSVTLFKTSGLTRLKICLILAFFLTKYLRLQIRVQVVESEAGKFNTASDAWSNPKMPGAVRFRSKLLER
jgi:hypothetical protein